MDVAAPFSGSPKVIGLLLAVWLLMVSPLAAQQQELDPAATQEYAVAFGLQSKKLPAQAAKRWQRFLQKFPKDPRVDKALHNLGVCQLQADQFAESAATFRNLLAKYPKFASRDASQFNLGLALYNIGAASKKPEDLRAAAAAFAELPAKYAQSEQAPTALYYQAECRYLAGDTEQAVPVYAQFVKSYPQHALLPDVRYALGAAQQQLGQHAEAAATFREFLAKHPQHELADECRLRSGLCLFSEKKFAEAEKSFAPLAAKADSPFADLALLRQAQCLGETGRVPQAIALYRSLLSKFPESKYKTSAQLEIGRRLFETGKSQEALAPLREVVAAKCDDSAAAAYWLGKAQIKLNQAVAAAATLDQAIKAYPQSDVLPHLLLTRIDALYEQPDKRKQTVAMYGDFAAQHPDHELAPQAHYMAGLAALDVEDFPAAKKITAAFLANPKFGKHPLTPDVLFVAGESHLLTEQADQAEGFYRKLIAANPQHAQAPLAQVRIGYCLYLDEKYADAVQALTQAVGKIKAPALLAEAQLLIGRCQADAGKRAEAVAALTAALKAKPDWTRADEVLLALAQNLHAQGKLPEAQSNLQRLLSAFSKSRLRDRALYELGQIAEQQKKLDDAVARYRETLSGFPEGDVAPLAAYGVGHLLFVKEDYSQAVQAFSTLLTRYADSKIAARGQYERGLAHHRLQQFEPGAKDLSAYLSTKPAEADALDASFALALCQVGLKQFDAAAKSLETLASNRDYARRDRALYELAFARRELKQDKESAAAFEQLATQLPKSPLAPESWFRLGDYHETAGRFGDAGAAYASGVKCSAALPDTPAELREKLQFKVGWAQYSQEKFDEAAASFQSQLKQFSKGALAVDAAYLAGDALYRQQRFDQALPLFAQVIAAKSQKYQPRALYRAGAAAGELKKWADSQRFYQSLVSQFGKFELINEARYGLGLALQNQQKLTEARQEYEQVTQATRTETAAKARFMIGRCCLASGKFEEALEHFVETSVYPYPEWQARAHFELGSCFVELKQPEKAIASFQTLVEKFPQHAQAAEAAKLIESLNKSRK